MRVDGEQTIIVTQVKSGISAKPKARGTLRALGLGRIGKTNTLPLQVLVLPRMLPDTTATPPNSPTARAVARTAP